MSFFTQFLYDFRAIRLSSNQIKSSKHSVFWSWRSKIEQRWQLVKTAVNLRCSNSQNICRLIFCSWFLKLVQQLAFPQKSSAFHFLLYFPCIILPDFGSIFFPSINRVWLVWTCIFVCDLSVGEACYLGLYRFWYILVSSSYSLFFLLLISCTGYFIFSLSFSLSYLSFTFNALGIMLFFHRKSSVFPSFFPL